MFLEIPLLYPLKTCKHLIVRPIEMIFRDFFICNSFLSTEAMFLDAIKSVSLCESGKPPNPYTFFYLVESDYSMPSFFYIFAFQ